MLGVPFEKRDTVRVGFIGLGARGAGLLKQMLAVEGVRITAVSDAVEERARRAREEVRQAGRPGPAVVGDWRRLCERNDVDLVYICSPWDWHVPQAVWAMECGRHAAVEVPAATTLADCWRLVNTSERTRRHCVLLENCCYDYTEMLFLNMVRAGVLGTITHGEAAYIHDLREWLMNLDWDWRRAAHRARNGNLYPTHGLGPVARYMDINRGDCFARLVSMSSREASLSEYLDRRPPDDHRRDEKYVCGDMNTSLIQTALGRTVVLQHDVVTPRPYCRINLIQGTKGACADYPPRVFLDGQDRHDWEPIDTFKARYEHPVWKETGALARKIGGHGGCDFIMNYMLIQSCRQGLPPDIDVYDAAAWSAPGPLSEVSVAKDNRPLPFPDFTRGRWRHWSGSEADQLLGGARFLEEVNLGERIRCYVFEDRRGRLLARVSGVDMAGTTGRLTLGLPGDTVVLDAAGAVFHPDGKQQSARRAGGVTIPLSRDTFHLQPPETMDRTTFIAGLNQVRLTGVAPRRLLRAQAAVAGAPGNRPVLTVTVHNLAPDRALRTDITAGTTAGSGWRVVKSAEGLVAPRQHGVFRLPIARMPRSPGRPAEITASVAVDRGVGLEARTRVLGVVRAPTGMAIDGRLSGWRGIPPTVIIDRPEQVHDSAPGTRWGGPADLSMRMRLAWDARNLYLAAEIRDDKFVMDRPPKTVPEACWYAADSLEIFLDAGAEHGVCHLYLVAGRGSDMTADWMCEPGGPPLENVRVASRFTGAGYTIEAAIPLASLPGIREGRPGRVIRFFAALNDRDVPGGPAGARKTGMIWHKIEEWWNNTAEYTSLVLLP